MLSPTLKVILFVFNSLAPTVFPTVSVEWSKIVTPQGDRLPDFSFSGYRGSDQPLPNIKSVTNMTLPQAEGDQTRRIQTALNQTARAGGGVVFLGRGNFSISPGLQIPSGVTLRGSGLDQTVLVLDEQPDIPVITMGVGGGADEALMGANITDTYVPIGTSVITVNSTEGFVEGQAVYVQRAVTADWVRYNGMSDLTRDGKDQTWIPVGTLIQQPNTVLSISGNKITLKIPLTDSLDAAYMEPQIVVYRSPPLSSEMGVEALSIHLNSPCAGTAVDSPTCNGAAVSFAPWAVDSWARNLSLTGFNQFIDVQYDAARLTIQDVAMYRDANSTGVGLPVDIWIKGSQVLVKDCGQYGLGISFSVMTGSLTPGPNAVLRHVTQSGIQSVYPHQRWAHGLLIEETSAPSWFVNRKNLGTGQGWSMNGGVGWNLKGKAAFESPPLGINWCIGCRGGYGQSGNGTFLNKGDIVLPRSLFQSQLEARGSG
ncbi:hypothetical protein QQZ08_011753 [Neonectria magnoliae]|uniref:Rhamnogalacturonase A/B/Epimerase-like pectate lyase domain-containing protein n=1 Tax=Neonectria magnoliae TaxID=2732573 RepID=A0ABR1H854_9HYPO